jgi:hypothetical protein
MRILRTFVSETSPLHAGEWSVVDERGTLLQHGRGADRPTADRHEAVVAAEAVRIAALTLPPMPSSRVAGAAAYALEDRIASPDRVAIAVGPRGDDGRVLAIVAERALVESLASATPAFARAVAEPDLAPRDADWHWCESETSAFVRTDDGSSFAVSRATDDALPPELSHALARAAREGHAPARVVAHRANPVRDEWSLSSGVAFVAGEPWRWERASAPAWSRAVDLLQAALPRATDAAPAPRFTTALVMLAAALVLHVIAMLASWGSTHVRLANLQRDLVPLARTAGAPAASPQSAVADIARLHAEARHGAGLQAPGDALPLLARASPALAALPGGALKTAVWTGGGWTLELTPIDEPTQAALVAALKAAGLTPLSARTPAGVRARIMP